MQPEPESYAQTDVPSDCILRRHRRCSGALYSCRYPLRLRQARPALLCPASRSVKRPDLRGLRKDAPQKRSAPLERRVAAITASITITMSIFIARAGRARRSAKLGMLLGMARITMAWLPRCTKMFTRKRHWPGRLYDMSQDPCSCSVAIA